MEKKMKFEFIDFYYIDPKDRKAKFKHNVGSIHIYAVDLRLDIRGIHVHQFGKKIFFKFPYFQAFDAEAGKKVFFPHLNFIDDQVKKDLSAFLNSTVKNEVRKKLALRE